MSSPSHPYCCKTANLMSSHLGIVHSSFQASNPNPSGTLLTTCSDFPLQVKAITWNSCIESRLSASVMVVCLHLLQQSGRGWVERPEVAAENEAPLRPIHFFRLAVWVDVSAERRRLADRFRVNKAVSSRSPLSDGGLCTRCLLSYLCCLLSESLLNQDFSLLSQTVFQSCQARFHG